jgi:putative heme-binding domain-containing protein
LGVDPWDIATDGVGPSAPLAAVLGELEATLERQAAVAGDETRADEERFAAARLLARTVRSRDRGVDLLAAWLAPQATPERQAAALEALGRSDAAAVPVILAKAWRSLGPASRSRAIEVWLSRPAWTADLLDRIADREIIVGSLTLPQRDRLRGHPDPGLAARAAAVLAAGPTPSRRDVLSRYDASLTGAGDAVRGRDVYLRACAACHRHGESGHDVGPNLATVAEHTAERMLTNILDPNADIQPGYQASTCVLTTGEVVSGIIVAETGGSLAMKLADGTVRTISRDEIDDVVTSNRSFMPEGLEEIVTVEQMRDLLVFLRGRPPR